MKDVFAFVKEVQTPLQVVVFLAAIGAIALSRWRTKTYSATLQHIVQLPEKDRWDAIRQLVGEPVPPKTITAKDFLLYKRQRYRYLLVLSTLVAVVVVILFVRATVYGQTISIGTNEGTLRIDNGGIVTPAASLR
jgi:hypothetical protein